MIRSCTIGAMITPPGEGGIAVLRLSGSKALSIAEAMTKLSLTDLASHTMHYTRVFDAEMNTLDTVLLSLMRAPKTFTGEDVVEISCHGGRLVARRVLERAIECGASPAGPGEFSLRAYANGKIDLSQAEAIAALIHAKSDRALFAATAQVQGTLSRAIEAFQKRLTRIAAVLEAWVDFPEEGLEFDTIENIVEGIKLVSKDIRALSETFCDGAKLNEGFTACLVGAPNVGKSSLLNALLGKERALVSAIPGTTRDTIEEELFLQGCGLLLIDTAGLRKTDSELENAGIERTKKALAKADIGIVVLDASKDKDAFEEAVKEPLYVWNKVDIAHEGFERENKICISTKTKEGIDELKNAIKERLERSHTHAHELVITRLRHKEALDEAVRCLMRCQELLQRNSSPEFAAFEMRAALLSLSSIIGRDVTEDVLTEIFSRFCIGK